MMYLMMGCLHVYEKKKTSPTIPLNVCKISHNSHLQHDQISVGSLSLDQASALSHRTTKSFSRPQFWIQWEVPFCSLFVPDGEVTKGIMFQILRAVARKYFHL